MDHGVGLATWPDAGLAEGLIPDGTARLTVWPGPSLGVGLHLEPCNARSG